MLSVLNVSHNYEYKMWIILLNKIFHINSQFKLLLKKFPKDFKKLRIIFIQETMSEKIHFLRKCKIIKYILWYFITKIFDFKYYIKYFDHKISENIFNYIIKALNFYPIILLNKIINCIKFQRIFS